MVRAVDLQWIAKNASRVIILISGAVALTPGGKRFPAERNNNLLAPFQRIRDEPGFLNAEALTVKPELPRPVEIQPVLAFERSALPLRPGIFRSRIKKSRDHKEC